MSPVNQSSSHIKPTTPLTPSAPSSPLFIQLIPTPLIPSAPSNFSPVITPPQHISPTPHDPSTNSKSPTFNLQQRSPNHAEKKPCKLYIQGHCMDGKKGSTCAYPHPSMCFKLKEDQMGVQKALRVNLHIQSYAAHYLSLESEIVIAVISIM